MKKKLISFLVSSILIFTYALYLSYLTFTFFSKIYNDNFSLSINNILGINLITLLKYIKLVFPFSIILTSLILSFSTYKLLNISSLIYFMINKLLSNSNIKINNINNNTNFNIYIGFDKYKKPIVIPELSLYQNILITGSIGTGKTTGTIYPILNQLLSYSNISGLILDVKGNMKNDIIDIFNRNNILNRLITIELNGNYKYNPLHKPKLKPYIIANRLIRILTIFSNKNTTDTYWFDKAEILLTNYIKLIRLYNNEYVTFTQLHKVVTSKIFLNEKLQYVKSIFLENKLNNIQKYDYNQILSYFTTEFIELDSKILSIILSEITRLTSIFVSDIDIEKTFCPKKEEINFNGFENIFSNNETILLNMNIGEYSNLSKIIATYLKLDFQTEILKRPLPIDSPTFFICDEYQTYVTESDSDFYSISREYKCINVVSTQSYSSLFNSLKNENTLKVLLQSFINKIFLRNDDLYTIETIQKLFGKEDKQKLSSSISENANETNYNYLLNIMKSKKSNITESLSYYTYVDNTFDSKDLSLNLKSFEAICYLSDGNSMLKPTKIKLIPYFERRNNNEKNTYKKKYTT